MQDSFLCFGLSRNNMNRGVSGGGSEGVVVPVMGPDPGGQGEERGPERGATT